MRKKVAIVSLLLLSLITTNAQKKQNASLAQKAFDAWSLGEKTGNYGHFKALITDDLRLFSHPLLGSFSNDQARFKLQTLIAEREVQPNNLIFNDIQLISNKNHYVFIFNSSGSVSGGFPYKGYNAIILTVENRKLVGFREYFGFVDPSWFK